jgi:general L-amino acid transport system permease protein
MAEGKSTAAEPRPVRRLSPLAWLRRNLFGSPVDAVLTLLIIWLLWMALVPMIEWALTGARWTGTGREACAGSDGACWVFVKARFDQFFYGFYPPSERWRVDLGILGVAAAGVPLFLQRVRHRGLLACTLLPLSFAVAAVLFSGGVLGLERVNTGQWGGLMLTLIVAVAGIVASFPLGILLALARRSDLPAIRTLAVIFIEFWRGVPLVTVLFMASVMLPLFLPEGVNFDKLLRALIGVTLFAGAYMAEVVRGGLQAVPRGQYEAAQALGLGYWRTMGLVVLPQALRHVIPGIVNSFIALFKDTTLVLIIGLFDFLGIIQAALSDPQWLGFAMEGYVFAAAVYWVFCFGISRMSARIERRGAQTGIQAGRAW